MTRKEELMKTVERLKKGYGSNYQDWVASLLVDIALSLATIADALTEKDGEKE